MPVKVSGGKGLAFTATLDISDALKKAQDLKKSISDLSVTANGISKGLESQKTATQGLNDAIKQTRLDTAELIKAKAQDNAQIVKNRLAIQEQTIATKAQLAAEKELAAQHKVPTSTGFPTAASTRDFSSPVPLGVAASSGTDELIRELNKDLKAGIISATEYRAAIDQIAVSESLFAQKTATTIAATEREIGVIEGLKIAIQDLNAQKLVALESDIPLLNKRIQEAEFELTKFNNVGKVGFDQFGNKVKAAAAEMEKPIGQYNRLAYAAKLYEQQSKTSTNPDIISKYNIKLQDAQLQMKQLANVGKKGFDEFGNAIGKSSGFIQKAGAKISQLLRILPGIGWAGAIAFAAEPIINYLSKLQLFGAAVDRAAQQLRLFNNIQRQSIDIRLSAVESTRTEITQLEALYKVTQNHKLSIVERTNAAIQLQNTYPTTLGNLTTEAILAGKGSDAYNKLKNSILDVAYAQSISAKIGTNSNRRLSDDLNITKEQTEQLRLNNILKKAVADPQNKLQIATKLTAKNYAIAITAQKDIEESKKREKDLITDRNIIDKENLDLETRRDNLIKKRGSKVLTGGVDVSSDNEYNAIESQKIALQADIDTQSAITNNLTKSISDRKAALKAGLDDSLKIIDLNEKQSLMTVKLSNSAKKVIIDKANAEKIKAMADYNEKVDNLSKKGEAAAKADAESLKEQLNLIRQVDEATASFNRKTLTEDQSALTAVSDKFDQLRKRIAVFNADPKNKDHKIDNSVITKLNLNESNAIDSQADTNENKYIQQDIEKKKKLYADYESYKIKAGSTAADAEYADLLKSGKDFATYLDNIKQSIDKTDTSGPIQERAELTQKQIDENVETQKKAYQELLDSTSTYTQQRQAMIETAAADEKELNEKGHADQAAQVRRYLSDRLLALDEEQFKEMDAYRYLFDNIETISEKSAKKQIATLYGMAAAQLATGEISMAAYLKLIKQLDEANVKIKNKLPDELKAIGEGLSGISSEASNFSEELSKALGVAGSLVSSVGSIKSNIANLQDSSASSVSKISSGLGIIGTAIGVFSTIYSLFDNSKEKAEQLAYANDLQIKSIEAVNKALERQLALIKDIQGPGRLVSYKQQLDEISAKEKSNQDQINQKYSLTGDKASDGIIAAGPDNPLFGQVIYNATRAGASVSLVGKSIEDLQKLMDEGKLDQKTIALVQSQIELQQQAKDTLNSLNEDITGISFDSLKDNIKGVFADGKIDAKSFADTIEQAIKGAFANSFERSVVEQGMQTFYNALADAGSNDQKVRDSAGNIVSEFTADEIAKLRDMKTEISNDLAAKAKVYQDIIGPDPTDPNSSAPSTLTADVKSITEDTGSIIAGTMHGIQLSNIQIKDLLTVQGKTIGDMYQVAQGNFAYLVKIEANTYRTANNTDLLIPTLLRIENKLGSGSSALAGNGRTG